MELRHLRYFRIVAQELNFRRAAERLFMEPQPLNFSIRQLERELGFRLFSHNDGRTQLTAAGETFSHDVESLLDATEQAVARAGRVARGEAGTLRLAIPSSVANTLVAPAIKRFHGTYPDVSFSVRQMTYTDQKEALQRAQLDLGMGIVPADDPRFAGRPLTRARPVVAVASSDELATLPVVPWQALQGRDAVVLDHEQAAIARKWIDGILAEHGVTIHESQSVADTESAIAFAGFGFGLAIVFAPAGSMPERPGVTFVELPPDAGDVELGAIWLHDDENPLREKFVETLAECATEVAPLAAPVK
jgi:DNA-binding transcriptional LysR family regulator